MSRTIGKVLRSSQRYACQSGRWAGLDGGKGIKAVFKPLAGMSLNCYIPNTFGPGSVIQARVLTDGTPQWKPRDVSSWTSGVIGRDGIIRITTSGLTIDPLGSDSDDKFCPW